MKRHRKPRTKLALWIDKTKLNVKFRSDYDINIVRKYAARIL